jgi:hypothetical protein
MSSPIEKSSTGKLDYGFDWGEPDGDWLESGEIIVASTWSVPTGLVKEDESFTDETTTVWLSGGVNGTCYDVTNHITTNSVPPKEDDRILKIKIALRYA